VQAPSVAFVARSPPAMEPRCFVLVLALAAALSVAGQFLATVILPRTIQFVFFC
jgi:hypothetical protein